MSLKRLPQTAKFNGMFEIFAIFKNNNYNKQREFAFN